MRGFKSLIRWFSCKRDEVGFEDMSDVFFSIDEVVKYLHQCAQMAGLNGEAKKELEELQPPEEFPQEGYSLAWYFKHYFVQDMHAKPAEGSVNILRAFIDVARGEEVPDYEEVARAAAVAAEELKRSLIAEQERAKWKASDLGLNTNQVEAVAKALTFPMSFVQGPPGTGKTMTIVRLIAESVARGQRVALVSSNRAAVANVEEKFKEIAGNPDDYAPKLVVAAGKVAALGDSKKRSEFSKGRSNCEFVALTGKDKVGFDNPAFDNEQDWGKRTGWEKSIRFDCFTSQHPVVLCTVHSLKKCFFDGAKASSKYDLVIMDESSQTSLLVGLVAMSCAKRMVLVGDEEQLPPIVDDSFNFLRKWDGYHERHIFFSEGLLRVHDKNASFMSLCKEAFAQLVGGTMAETFLAKHYRCHPGIIKFCSDKVYQGKLEIRTPVEKLDTRDVPVPIEICCYPGVYNEPYYLSPGDDESRSSVNYKQLRILKEEYSAQIRHAVAKGKTVCVLTPFRGQVKLVKEFLEDLLSDMESATVKEVDGEALEDNESSRRSSAKNHSAFGVSVEVDTVHKAQGREFDVVYLLPVEDGQWEWPWSQGKRLVNVAVSRAKEELRVIVSTAMMENELQDSVLGFITPTNGTTSPNDQEMYVRKLADYVHEHPEKAQSMQAGYGIRVSGERSVFDALPFYRVPGVGQENSGPARLMRTELEALCRLENLGFASEVSTTRGLVLKSSNGNSSSTASIVDYLNPNGDGTVPELFFDFVIFDKNTRRVLLAIEVDGGYHRTHKAVQENDAKKDTLVAQLGGEVLRGNCDVELEGHFGLLRLPTTGETSGEIAELGASSSINSSGSQTYAIEDIARHYRAKGTPESLVPQVDATTGSVLSIAGDVDDLVAGKALSMTKLKQELKRPEFAGKYGYDVETAKALEKMSVKDMQRRLYCCGYLHEVRMNSDLLENQKSFYVPTQKGLDHGISLAKGKNRDGRFYRYLVYKEEAYKAVMEVASDRELSCYERLG